MKTVLASKMPAETTKSKSKQFTTFSIDGKVYGIDVMKVQEVTKPLEVTSMRTAPDFIKGLINLRGQIATAVGLRELFKLPVDSTNEKMTVVCRIEDVLLSLLVDNIGDVIEVEDGSFENTPLTVPSNIRPFMEGVYKTDATILSILNIDSILLELDKRCAS
jgi:purine-binding chemotaxis protein CheW